MSQEMQTRHSPSPWFFLSLGVFLTVGLTLHLSAENFHSLLSSDHLYPHMFVKDWLFGGTPVDAWKFGSATFLFPDYLIYAPLLMLLGDSGLSYPVFGVVNMLMLGAACGFAIHRLSRVQGLMAFAAGFHLLGLLLALQYLPNHGFNLYWLLLPGFHGSCLTLGITITTILIRAHSEKRPLGTAEKSVVLVLGILGAYSNTLLITLFLLPWLATIPVVDAPMDGRVRSLFWQHLRICASILAGVIAIRLALAAANFWEYGNLFRHFPFPVDVWKCFLEFASDFREETALRLWAFWALLLLAGGMAFTGRSGRARPSRSAWRVFGVFVVLSVFSGVLLPILSLYWKGFYGSRYFLNLLILPGLGLGVWGLSKEPARRFLHGRAVSVISILVACAAGVQVYFDFQRAERFYFEYPAKVEEFDRMVDAYDLSLGLSDYWRSHLYNQLGRGDVFLNHITAEGRPFFWCNNVYWFFGNPPAEDEDPIRFPDYDFVLTDGLDEAAIRERFGEPREIIRGAFNTLFIYRGHSDAIRTAIAPEIVEWLDGKSLRVAP